MIKGRGICKGQAKGTAMVFQQPFSFIGDVDVHTGEITMLGSSLAGQSLQNRILVIPTGHGGTIAPFMAYLAAKKGTAPKGIICNFADNITIECGIVMGIPVIDCFSENITECICQEQELEMDGMSGTVIFTEKGERE